MTERFTCRFITGNNWDGGKQNVHLNALLDIYPGSGGKTRRLAIYQTQSLELSYGDRIKCLSGEISVLIKLSRARSGFFVLVANSPSCIKPHYRTELVMNDKATRAHQGGTISVADDIGSISKFAGASSESVGTNGKVDRYLLEKNWWELL